MDAPHSAAAALDIPVTGMTCAACVRRVEKALAAAPGAESAAVNLAAERAHVRLAKGADVAPVLAAIRSAGYEPAETTVDLAVAEMTCAACVRRVEKALLAVPGALAASVNLATGRASVRAIGGAPVARAPAAAAPAAARGRGRRRRGGGVLRGPSPCRPPGGPPARAPAARRNLRSCAAAFCSPPSRPRRSSSSRWAPISRPPSTTG